MEVLTDSVCAAAKAETRTNLTDARVPGLILAVYPSGVKSWQFRFKSPKTAKRVVMTLGRYPSVSLADARAQASEAYAAVQRGRDPRYKVAAEMTVAGVCASYLEGARAVKKTWKQDEHRINRYFLPAWGPWPASNVSRQDCLQLLQGIAATAPVQANRVYALLRVVFTHAQDLGAVEAHPCLDLRKLGKERPRQRRLTDQELAKLMEALDAGNSLTLSTWAFYWLSILTGQRGEQIRQARRDDFREGVWYVRTETTKTEEPHQLPLSPQALAVVRRATQEGPEGSPWLLPQRHNAELPMSRPNKTWKRLQAESGVRCHTKDLRRTLRSWLAENGVLFEVCELILAHKLPGIAAVYDVHRRQPEMREALVAWANHLESLTAS